MLLYSDRISIFLSISKGDCPPIATGINLSSRILSKLCRILSFPKTTLPQRSHWLLWHHALNKGGAYSLRKHPRSGLHIIYALGLPFLPASVLCIIVDPSPSSKLMGHVLLIYLCKEDTISPFPHFLFLISSFLVLSPPLL